MASTTVAILAASAAALLFSAASPAADSMTSALWRVGNPGKHGVGMALQGNYRNSALDGWWAVGESQLNRDWPYVQPGPDDGFAGKRRHAFRIVFGLAAAPAAAGEAQLEIAACDVYRPDPPAVAIAINGRKFDRQFPAVGGVDYPHYVEGASAPARVTVNFPVTLLHAGDNEIAITTVKGSYFLYDTVTLTAPGAMAAPLATPHTFIAKSLAIPAERVDGKEPVLVSIRHFGPPSTATVKIESSPDAKVSLGRGEEAEIELSVPAAAKTANRNLVVNVADGERVERSFDVPAVRHLTIYVLPHSHTDIGYTELQPAVAAKQVNNLLQGIDIARRTQSYPAGSRFVWNVEVLWAADLYLHRLSAEQKSTFIDAVSRGWVALNGSYLNELTGLCRPEELIQLFRCATQLSALTHRPIDTAMFSDVPGYTWGTVTAMNQAGIRYFSAAPNFFDRIGTILRDTENEPFYWVAPDHRTRVLAWVPYSGYGLAHRYGKLTPTLVRDLYDSLERHHNPYDITYVRWVGHGDNAVPDPAISDLVRDWNAAYVWPKFIISTSSEAFHAFEARYGAQLPVRSGDWTGYWEDGAASSALETAHNRANSDRLVQAEATAALLNPSAYDATRYDAAWKNVLLYSEHTWGASASIRSPEAEMTKAQWAIKAGYVADADQQSTALLNQALGSAPVSASVEVVNTLGWERTELATISAAQSAAGDRVTDDQGRPVPSQRLSTGELVFLVRHLPALSTRFYTLSAGAPGSQLPSDSPVRVGADWLANGVIRVRLDLRTGGVAELSRLGLAGNFAATADGARLNDYLYLQGDDLHDLRRAGAPKISVGERGPLVASLIVESSAPGCKSLRREVRLTAGLDQVELLDLVDKARLIAKSYMAKEGKESVNFAFPFNVPNGQIRIDLPWAVMRPETDQLPGSCKNWYCVSRWTDVSNAEQGVTWVTLDAPLIEVGGLYGRLINSQTNPDVWRAHVDPTQTFYSWAMNNHWGTNYRAYQEGPTLFRFILRPHAAFAASDASRFAVGFSQPLLTRPVPPGDRTAHPSLLRIDDPAVLVETLKPVDEDHGRSLILRLFNASALPAHPHLTWGIRPPVHLSVSGTAETADAPAAEPLSLAPWGAVTLRADFP